MAQAPVGPGRRDPEAALAWYRAELNERLVVHWTGGAWRVPLATRHLTIEAVDGSRLGRIICANGTDGVRAMAGLRPGPLVDPARLDALLAPVADLLGAVRAWEGASGDRWDPDLAAHHLSRPPPLRGPVTLLTAAAVPLPELAAILTRAAVAGALWKPAPQAAASAHLLMRALAPALGEGVALLQGDHSTGAALASLAPPLWAGEGAPPAGLGVVPVL